MPHQRTKGGKLVSRRFVSNAIPLLFGLVISSVLATLVIARLTPVPRDQRYHRWWDETAACVGTRYVPEPTVTLVDSLPGGYLGHTDPVVNQVWILRTYADSEWVIKHEFMHALIGKPGHPVIPFTFCGGLHIYGYDE